MVGPDAVRQAPECRSSVELARITSFRNGGREVRSRLLTFDLDGRNLRYARAIRRELVSAALDSRSRTVILLPSIGLDYVTHIAQSPTDQRLFAIATDRRHVFVTKDVGKAWRQIAKDGDLP